MDILVVLFASSSLILLILFISLLLILFKSGDKESFSIRKGKEDLDKIKKHIIEDNEDEL